MLLRLSTLSQTGGKGDTRLSICSISRLFVFNRYLWTLLSNSDCVCAPTTVHALADRRQRQSEFSSGTSAYYLGRVCAPTTVHALADRRQRRHQAESSLPSPQTLLSITRLSTPAQSIILALLPICLGRVCAPTTVHALADRRQRRHQASLHSISSDTSVNHSAEFSSSIHHLGTSAYLSGSRLCSYNRPRSRRQEAKATPD